MGVEMRSRLLQKQSGALVAIRRRSGPTGEVLIGIAHCQSCDAVTIGVIVRDAYDEQYVVCKDCITRGMQLFDGGFPASSVEVKANG